MALVADPAVVEPMTAALLGAIDVNGGPTAEQLAVLRAVVHHVWARDDLTLESLPALDPEPAAAAVTQPGDRRRLHELLVVLELCRHPETPEQVAMVERYAAALGAAGPDLEIVRAWIDDGTAGATEDFDRFYADKLEALSEPTLRATHLRIDEPDLGLAQQLEALHDLPAGTLGHAYIEFYRRNGLTLPGADVHTPAHYVSHDMNHVIAGYEPTGPGEIALGGLTLAMRDDDANWIQFVANLTIHEAGILRHGNILPASATLARPGATDLLGEALWRGAQCTVDFSQADHLAMATWSLDDVRAHFAVPPLAGVAG